jgi:hypothetical protein
MVQTAVTNLIAAVRPQTAALETNRRPRSAVGGQKITKPHFIDDFGKNPGSPFAN